MILGEVTETHIILYFDCQSIVRLFLISSTHLNKPILIINQRKPILDVYRQLSFCFNRFDNRLVNITGPQLVGCASLLGVRSLVLQEWIIFEVADSNLQGYDEFEKVVEGNQKIE